MRSFQSQCWHDNPFLSGRAYSSRPPRQPQTKSATIYNRDSQILLQYKVLKLINLIRTKRLKPDASRAERLSMMVGNQASGGQEELSEAFQEPDIEASADESEDADLDDDSGPPGGLDNYLEALGIQSRNMETNFLWYMHCFTGVVHAADIASPEDRLLCGRSLTVNLVSIDVSSTEARTGLMCMQCSSVMNRNAVPAADLEWGMWQTHMKMRIRMASIELEEREENGRGVFTSQLV